MSQELHEIGDLHFNLDLSQLQGVCFDPESISLQGVYTDELSLFRARKIWMGTLETNFMLEKGRDFAMEAVNTPESARFILKCSFLTACGRYAFWRLTNNQVPHVQYQIETAHIPDSLSRHLDFVSAPDLKPIAESPLVLGPGKGKKSSAAISDWLMRMVQVLARSKGRR